MKKYKVEYTPRFNQQLQELYDYIYYQYQSPYDALRLVTKIRKKCKSLEVFPKGYAVSRIRKGTEFRFAHVGNHIIIYTVDDEPQVVIIWALIYSRRDITRLIEEQ